MKITVTVYERSQIYGGPEEGGWWTHVDDVVKRLQFKSRRAARRWIKRLHGQYHRRWLRRHNNGWCRYHDREPELLWNYQGRMFGAHLIHKKHGELTWVTIEQTPGCMAYPTATHYE